MQDSRIDDKISANDSKESDLFHSKDKKSELMKTSKEAVVNENCFDIKTPAKCDIKDNKNKIKIDAKKPDQPIGIHINSPNSNVRIQGSKIEVKEKASTKREIDLSSVILRVPDPSRFLSNQELKKKKSKMVVDQAYEDKLPMSESSERFTSPSSLAEPLKLRPERSAKKRAKDSILEMTEAENVKHIDYKFSPTHHSDFHTPLAIKSRDYYRNEFYNERISPFREGRSPIQNEASPFYHSNYSPSKYIRSPNVHSISEHALSPRTHMRSPPASENLKHHHYTQPLSPRYYDTDSHFYSERSRSPMYYEYVDKEHYVCEKSPQSSKHAHDLHSPSKRKEDKVAYRTSEQFKTVHVKHHHNLHSTTEDRFPYGQPVNEHLEGKFNEKRPMPSPSVEASYHYQPLSRTRTDAPDIKLGKNPERKVQDKPRSYLQPPVKVYEKSQSINTSNSSQPRVLSSVIDKKRLGDQKTTRDPPTSFYPTDQPLRSSKLPAVTQRPVIEITKQSIRTPPERNTGTPTSKERKGIGSLLEMKIQGLKKQRLEQLSDSSNDGHGVTSPDFKTASSDVSSSTTSTIDTTGLESILPKLGNTQAVKCLNLDNIAKSLTKSAEKSSSLHPEVLKKVLSDSSTVSQSASNDIPCNLDYIPAESNSSRLDSESRVTVDTNITSVNKSELKNLDPEESESFGR